MLKSVIIIVATTRINEQSVHITVELIITFLDTALAGWQGIKNTKTLKNGKSQHLKVHSKQFLAKNILLEKEIDIEVFSCS